MKVQSNSRAVLLIRLLSCIWQKRKLACTFDRRGQHALILRARSRYTTRQDLAAFTDELLERIYIFVVDVGDLVHREVADFATLVAAAAVVRSSLFALARAGLRSCCCCCCCCSLMYTSSFPY